VAAAGPDASAGGAAQQVGGVSSGQHQVSPWLFLWLTVAATGGPLALAALYVPGVLGDARGAAGLVAILGAVLFVPPLLIWLRYSSEITGPGGLYWFVEAGAGRVAARVQGALWVLSYLFYLVYTTTFIAYDVLPAVFPGMTAARPLAQLLAAGVVVVLVLAPVRRTLVAVAGLAMGQLALVAALVAVELGHPGGSAVPAASTHPGDLLFAGGNLSVLFICAGLPLFLGGEARGGSRTVRSGLARGWAIAAAATVAAAVPMAALAPQVLTASLPGAALADAAGLPTLAKALGIGVAASVVGVMVAEFLALSRLLHAMTGQAVRRVSGALAVVLVAGSAASLVEPQRVYEDLLKPSLIALWLSQLLVFLAYPLFVYRRHPQARGALAGAIAVAAAASALMIFGLWSTIQNQLGT
jgi:amino acid transporter